MDNYHPEGNKYWKEFENLAVEYVQQVYCKNGRYRFVQTQYLKDGGFDAKHTTEIFEDDTVVSLLEAKLRKSNLGLRDVSASVIIAFNLGAYCIFIVTNHAGTPQLRDSIELFQNKTNLKIRLIDGTELSAWVNAQFMELSKKYSVGFLQYLQKQYNSENTYPPVKQKHAPADSGEASNQTNRRNLARLSCSSPPQKIFRTNLMERDISKLIDQISSGLTILLKGPQGVGKSVLIEQVRKNTEKNMCYVLCDMSIALSSRVFFLKLLSGILGLDSYNALAELDDDDIISIASIAENTQQNKQLSGILMHIFKVQSKKEAPSEITNLLLAEYISNLLVPYQRLNQYVFYFHNLEYAAPEVLNFLLLIAETLKSKKIACIIEMRTPLSKETFYDSPSWERYVALFEHLTDSQCIYQICEFSENEAINFIKQELPGIDSQRAKIIVDSVGTIPMILSCTIGWLKEEKVVNEYAADQFLVDKYAVFFNAICPQNALAVLAEWLELLRARHGVSDVLIALDLFDGNIPVELMLEVFDVAYSQPLIERGLAKVEYGQFCVANHLLLRVLKEQNNPLHRYSVARRFLTYISSKLGEAYDETLMRYSVLLQRACFEWEYVAKNAAALAQNYQKELQFANADIYLTYSREAYERLYRKLPSNQHLIEYIEAATRELDNSIFMGKICNSQNLELIDTLQTIECELPEQAQGYYKMLSRFYMLKYNFEAYRLPEAQQLAGVLLKELYEKPNAFNANDLSGRILAECALIEKSGNGYDAANRQFQEYSTLHPESAAIKVGFLSHTSCMNLCVAPKCAINTTQQLIDYVNGNNLRNRFPLFHEYGDLALAALMAKEYAYAMDFAENSNAAAKANGVWLQQGRAENFIACILWAENAAAESIQYHLEKSCFLLEKADEGHYLWRSRINLCTMLTMNGSKTDEALALARASSNYICQAPERVINALKQEKPDYRRYAAVLQLYKAFSDLEQKDECRKILKFFSIDKLAKHANAYCVGNLSISDYFTSVLHRNVIWSLG